MSRHRRRPALWGVAVAVLLLTACGLREDTTGSGGDASVGIAAETVAPTGTAGPADEATPPDVSTAAQDGSRPVAAAGAPAQTTGDKRGADQQVSSSEPMTKDEIAELEAELDEIDALLRDLESSLAADS